MQDWKTHELGELATVGAGNSAPQEDALFVDGTVPFFRTSDVGRIRFGDIDSAADCLNERGTRGLRRFPIGTILFPKSGASTFLNHRVMMQTDGCVSSHLATIVAKPGQAEPRFLLYFLATVQAQDLVQDHAYPSLNLPLINGINVPTPPLAEQRRIVEILDEAFEAIGVAKGNAEKNLQSARTLFESKLIELFSVDGGGWPRKTLRAISRDFGRGKSKHRPRNDPKLYGGPYPFIQTGDVRNSDHLITEYTQTYSETGLMQSKLWPKGTLCITIAANIAETGVLAFDACFPDSVIGVVVDETQTSSKYLEYMLQTAKADLKAKGKGSAQDNINLATFENELYPFPDIDTQMKIVNVLDELSSEVRQIEDIYSRKLVAIDELKKSLLHHAFKGQLTTKKTDQLVRAVA